MLVLQHLKGNKHICTHTHTGDNQCAITAVPLATSKQQGEHFQAPCSSWTTGQQCQTTAKTREVSLHCNWAWSRRTIFPLPAQQCFLALDSQPMVEWGSMVSNVAPRAVSRANVLGTTFWTILRSILVTHHEGQMGVPPNQADEGPDTKHNTGRTFKALWTLFCSLFSAILLQL